MEAKMNCKVITEEIYERLDDFTYSIERIKHASHILSEIMVDCEFKQWNYRVLH